MNHGEGLRLRPCAAVDAEFLYRVYVSTRQEELAQVPWDDAAKEAFLRMQFHAQDTHYHTHYADADYQIVEQAGVPIGRLYVQRSTPEMILMDIALLPDWRGKGLGTKMICALVDEADLAGKITSLHVEQFNPAMRLYTRLGFVRFKEEGIYCRMERQPTTMATADA